MAEILDLTGLKLGGGFWASTRTFAVPAVCKHCGGQYVIDVDDELMHYYPEAIWAEVERGCCPVCEQLTPVVQLTVTDSSGAEQTMTLAVSTHDVPCTDLYAKRLALLAELAEVEAAIDGHAAPDSPARRSGVHTLIQPFAYDGSGTDAIDRELDRWLAAGWRRIHTVVKRDKDADKRNAFLRIVTLRKQPETSITGRLVEYGHVDAFSTLWTRDTQMTPIPMPTGEDKARQN